MSKDKIAVIIPTLNEEKFIAQCLDSVINQTFPFENLDVMVVDGGSSDRTREIVNLYNKKYPNIRLLDNPGRIQSIAFNIGVHNSDAPFIIRLDAHAIFDREYISICKELLSKNYRFGNVGGEWNILPQHSRTGSEVNAIINQLKFGIGGASFRIGAEAGPVDTVPFGAFPRKVVEKIGGMREDLPRGEDNEYNSRIRKAGFTVYLDPRIKCTYFARPDLKSSCQQMYNNGFSIGNLFHIDRKAVGLRHIIPLMFVLSLVLGLVLAIIIPKLWYIPTGIFAVYVLAAIIATIDACSKFGWKFFFILPIYFFSIHISYGFGTLFGLFKKYKTTKINM